MVVTTEQAVHDIFSLLARVEHGENVVIDRTVSRSFLSSLQPYLR